jgi:ribosomal protein S18 acetylase RimI-like enzyme
MAYEVTLRRCGPGDEAALAQIGAATFLETFAGIVEGAHILAHCEKAHAVSYYQAWIAAPGSALWLAEAQKGAPVGYVGLAAPDLPLPDIDAAADTEIKRIYVLHRFHGEKVGARLMGEALAAAKAAGRRRALLGVYAGNERAISFYRKWGFETAGTRRFAVGAGLYDDLVLARTL